MKKWLLLSLFSLLLWSQPKSEGPFAPSEAQKLKLENLQLKKVLAYRDANDAVTRYNQAALQLKEGCLAVVTENHWPQNVTCDEEKLTFSQSAPKSPEVKK